MTDFIHFEAEVDSDSDLSENDENVDQNLDNFIVSDQDVIQDSESFYRQIQNVESDPDQILEQSRQQALKDLEEFDEISNLDEDDVIEMEIDNFPKFEINLKKFEQTLRPVYQKENPIKNQICHVIIEALKCKENNIASALIEEINQPQKFKFIVDQQYFFNMCYDLTIILSKFNYFLRVFELKKKFRYLFLKNPNKQTVAKTLSSCITEKFNGFTIIRNEYAKKIRKEFSPIDIIYKPTKNIEIEPICYYTTDISLAYSATYFKKDKRRTKDYNSRSSKVQSCYYCNRFFVHNDSKYQKHIKQCSSKPGIVYNFTNQSLISYEDNFKSKGDLPFAMYFDFETTAPTTECLDPEQKKMFVVSYVIVVAFHPLLKLDKIIVNRSYGHTLKQLASIDYFSREQLAFAEQYLLTMLGDYAKTTAKKTYKNSLGEMFSVEVALIKKTLLKWFNLKFKKGFSAVNPIEKMKFEMDHKVDMQKSKCCICKFPLRLNITEFDNNTEITYGDFIVRYEYKFLRNILKEEDLFGQIENLQAYYDFFKNFINVCIGLLSFLNANRREILNEAVEEFIQDEFSDMTVHEIKNFIQKTDIKNALSQSKGEVYKFNLKLYAFVYDTLSFLPKTDFEYDTVTSDRFFVHVHRLIKGKNHLHHSHVTGNIYGYAHDFCNTTVIEKTKSEIPLIAHNFFGFDIFYYVKTFVASAWCSKKLNIGGTNLTHVNYGILEGEIRLIDSMKYYQKSLAALSSTLNQYEKEQVEKLTVQFFNQHLHFSTIWPYLQPKTQKEILEIVSGGKGIIPYELIVQTNSLSLTPDDGKFWSKTEFYSELKMQQVDDQAYENSKFLYTKLKMRNLSDLNDLYNFQDVALLCEILENRFQLMHDRYGFNPRKCNSASTLSGCIEREMSKVILTLPTNVEHNEIFEETVIGGFSCVNNRLAFDTQILLPKFTDKDGEIKRDFNFKVAYNLTNQNNQKKEHKRVIAKILKLDENNQYGHGMTKPLPTGCIKTNYDVSFQTLNFLLQRIDLEKDVQGHLYIVDIEFDFKNATKQQLVYNEIYPCIIEKQKIVDPCERSTYQLLEQLVMGEKGPKSYKKTSKSHANMFGKKFIALYLEHLNFCIKRAGWKVTKIHSHFTFDQEPFKKNFIIMNQTSRQQATDDVTKDFFKLMNNSNFGYDCRNNLDNCKFNPIFDELKEITNISRYHNIFDKKVEDFVSPDLLKQNIEETFNDNVTKLNSEDPFYQAKYQAEKNTYLSKMESVEHLANRRKKLKRKMDVTDYPDRIKKAYTDFKVKNLIDFDENQSASIKAVSVEQNSKVKLTTRYLNGKMLMFAKLSIKSFVYDIIDVFMFPDATVTKIYQKYDIENCIVEQNLTDTDSTSIFFIFICNLKNEIPENEARNIIFEVMLNSKLFQRLDRSSEFYEQFNARDKNLKKKVGYFEIEQIEKDNIITIALNPKEYYERFIDSSYNKKHKGLSKNTKGMDFESYVNRLSDLTNYFDNFLTNINPVQRIEQKRFQVKNESMQMQSVQKVQFGQLNDKRFYFCNGLTSLPFGHPHLDLCRQQKDKYRNIHNVIQSKKHHFLEKEAEVENKSERLNILNQIFHQRPIIYELKSTKNYKYNEIHNTINIIKAGFWK